MTARGIEYPMTRCDHRLCGWFVGNDMMRRDHSPWPNATATGLLCVARRRRGEHRTQAGGCDAIWAEDVMTLDTDKLIDFVNFESTTGWCDPFDSFVGTDPNPCTVLRSERTGEGHEERHH